MNIKRAASHDIRMNDEASARGQPQAPPFTFPLPLFSYWFSGLPPLLLIRGMCQQATIKRLMAISLYAPISVIQCQALPRLGDGGQATCLLWLHASWHECSECGGGRVCLATWPGHVSSIRPQTKCYKYFFPLTYSCERVKRVCRATQDGSKNIIEIYYINIIYIFTYVCPATVFNQEN